MLDGALTEGCVSAMTVGRIGDVTTGRNSSSVLLPSNSDFSIKSPPQYQPLAGTNTMSINMATMIKAIEFWLNSEVFQADVTVESVDYVRISSAFDIRFCLQEDSN